MKQVVESSLADGATMLAEVDEPTVERGIKLTAAAGAVIAATEVEANYTVKLVWKRHLSPHS